MTFYSWLLFLPVAWCLYNTISWIKNYNRVRHLDIPKILNPISPCNVIWIITQSTFLPILTRLPFGLGNWTYYSRWGWEYDDKYRTHAELGSVWMQITSANNWIYVADPGAINQIFAQPEDFRRPLQLYSMLDIFGQNVATCEGVAWKRHRKITARTFSEYNHNLVWNEAQRQCEDMLKYWLSHGAAGMSSTAKDVRTMSLNVLAYAGFRKSYPFQATQNCPSDSYVDSFRNSLALVLDNALLTLAVPPKVLRLPYVPKRWSRVGWAIETLQTHILQLYNEGKYQSFEKENDTGNLLSSMIAATENARQEANQEMKSMENELFQPRQEGLSMSEMFGNVFVYYFAGHDTTAAVFAYAILLLAANKDCQDWIAEELQHVLVTGDGRTWEYNHAFPQLKRCLAVLFETIRLYDPIPALPKWTGECDRRLQVNGRSLVIPAKTMILPSLMAIHTDPQYWGKDSLIWRPSRWILSPTEPAKGCNGLENESFFVPQKGTYFPWSDGQRNCPGKKFAQVEFVAVMISLFRDHSVHPVIEPGESTDQAREHILRVVNDSSLTLLLQMRNASAVRLRWERRR